MSRPITANSTIGRILLALRAGRMTTDAFYERFPTVTGYLTSLQHDGYIARVDGFYVITAAGLQACPSRRDAPLEPMHASPSNMSRKHGWSSTRQGAAA
jgi:starvation-inducible outer membrane lipoprotein